MFSTLAPLLVDPTTGHAAVAALANITAAATDPSQHITTVAAPLWDIGANFKTQGIRFATFMIMGGTALIAMFLFFVSKDKTHALKVAAIGVVLMGIVNALPSLGVVSSDTVNSVTNSR